MTAHKSVWIACNPCDDEVTAAGETYGMHDDWQTVAEVRARARDAGWTYANGRDICPAHRDAGAR